MKNNRYKNRGGAGVRRNGFSASVNPANINTNTSLDSNGPCGKIRGTAYQIMEKYQAVAKDAAASGDYILSEVYLQHAEHFYRLHSAALGSEEEKRRARGVSEAVPLSALAESGAAGEFSAFDGERQGQNAGFAGEAGFVEVGKDVGAGVAEAKVGAGAGAEIDAEELLSVPASLGSVLSSGKDFATVPKGLSFGDMVSGLAGAQEPAEAEVGVEDLASVPADGKAVAPRRGRKLALKKTADAS